MSHIFKDLIRISIILIIDFIIILGLSMIIDNYLFEIGVNIKLQLIFIALLIIRFIKDYKLYSFEDLKYRMKYKIDFKEMIFALIMSRFIFLLKVGIIILLYLGLNIIYQLIII